ncbi:MAG TPA: adenylate/guanylate cyclase domain-containing protein [Myxococcales bacterium]|nr:adenylate/guanylate cyclase domain-containing protein [Myxococcales bacterium]
MKNVVELLRPAHRTQNLAILLSDMKGFTARTSQQTREENARMLAFHDAILLPVIRGFGGRKVKSIGDALLVTFRSPTDCVLCGMAMQDRLASWNTRRGPQERIEVRIAISLGEVRVDADDVTGDPVQLALRASAFADAGEVVLTESVYLAMNKSEVPTEPFPVRELRSGETRLHRARMIGQRELPYGGRALQRLGKLRDPRLPLATRAAAFVTRRWPALALLAVCALAAAASWRVRVRRENDPVLRAGQMLVAKAPLAALAELDKLSDSPRARSAQVQVLRGKAEHALGQLGMAFADFAAALDVDAGVSDPEVVRALVDDLESEAFPLQWRPALVRTLGERVGASAAEPLRGIVRSQHGRARREALEALELMGQARDEDRLALATAELSDRGAPCTAVLNAVRVLVVAGTERAQALLARTTAERRRCGSREAADALRRFERAKAEAGAAAHPGAPASASIPTTATSTTNPTPATGPSSSSTSRPALATSPTSASGTVQKPGKETVKRQPKPKTKSAQGPATAPSKTSTPAAKPATGVAESSSSSAPGSRPDPAPLPPGPR